MAQEACHGAPAKSAAPREARALDPHGCNGPWAFSLAVL